MKSFAIVILAATLAAPIAIAEDAADATDDPCGLAGYKPGVELTAEQASSKYMKRGTPKTVSPGDGLLSYKVKLAKGAPYDQFVFLDRFTIAAVVREFDGDAGQKVYLALEEKYGEPEAADLAPDAEMKFRVFGGSTTLESRALWRDDECGMYVEFIKQTKTKFSPYTAGSKERVAVFVTEIEPADLSLIE